MGTRTSAEPPPVGMLRGEAHMQMFDPDIPTSETIDDCHHVKAGGHHFVGGCCHGGHGRHVAPGNGNHGERYVSALTEIIQRAGRDVWSGNADTDKAWRHEW